MRRQRRKTAKNISEDFVDCSFSESEAPRLFSNPLVPEALMSSNCRGRGRGDGHSSVRGSVRGPRRGSRRGSVRGSRRGSGFDFDISERTSNQNNRGLNGQTDYSNLLSTSYYQQFDDFSPVPLAGPTAQFIGKNNIFSCLNCLCIN